MCFPMTAINSSSSVTTTQAKIQIVTSHMTFYGPIVLLTVGIFGCLCNFLTFTSRQLRKNACGLYFLWAAIFELLSITFGLVSRLAADHLGSHLQNTNRIYCKLRAYLVSAMPLIATYLVLLSAIDRYMSSSIYARFRAFSQMKIAYRCVVMAMVMGFLSCSHILFSYDLRPKCGTLPGSYALFDGMFVVFWLGVIPHVLMLAFGFATLMNIRRSRQRRLLQFQILHHQAPPDQKTDAQLIVVMDCRSQRQRMSCAFLCRWCSCKLAWVHAWFSLERSTTRTIFSHLLWLAQSEWLDLFSCRSPRCSTTPTMPNRSISTLSPVNCFDPFSSNEWNSAWIGFAQDFV